eukprot:jgi/Hompol1/2423/HPOL_006004-RA
MFHHPRPQIDVLDILMQQFSWKILSDSTQTDDILNHTLFYSILSFRILSSTLASVFSMLQRHPDEAQKLQVEVDAIWTSSKGLQLPDVLSGIPAVDRFIRETLRLYPTFPRITRISQSPVDIFGFKFARGTRFDIDIRSVHRHASVWEDSEVFRPDRWVDKDVQQSQSNAYYPFGICAGLGDEAEAKLESLLLIPIKAAVVVLLRHVKLSFDPDCDVSHANAAIESFVCGATGVCMFRDGALNKVVIEQRRLPCNGHE